MFNIGPMELMLILVLALIIFGPKKLPEIGKTVGRSLREFRQASLDIRRELAVGMPEQATASGSLGQDGAAIRSNGASAPAPAESIDPPAEVMAPHPPAQERPAPTAEDAPGA